MEIPRAKDWPRAPIHRLGSDGIYMITAATLHKTLLFNTPEKLSLLEDNLLTLSKKYRWHLEAWAVFANHYHFIARNEVGSDEMWRFLKHLHTDSSRFLNRLDNAAGRKVWYNFWDKRLTFETSYFARLNYVHQNPVKHGFVEIANQYHWCSAAWFERTASPANVKTIYSFKADNLKIDDDY